MQTTYRKPVENMAMTPIFFQNVSLIDETAINGRTKMTISSIRAMEAVGMPNLKLFRYRAEPLFSLKVWPGGGAEKYVIRQN